MNRIRYSAKIHRLYKKLNYKYMDYDEVIREIVKEYLVNDGYPLDTRMLYKDYIGIEIEQNGGNIELPFRFDWFAKMVEYYGMESAVTFSAFIARKWLELR